MASIILTKYFGTLPDWPGRLFELPSGATPTVMTATTTTVVFPATGTSFPNYKMTITGTGFTYDNGMAIAGSMSTLSIYDASNRLIIRFNGLNGNDFVSDLASLADFMLGSANGPGQYAEAAWSQLMSGNDTITGTADSDGRGLVGMDAGNDVYNMGAGDDFVNGGSGNDTINGGDGYDVYSFESTAFSTAIAAIRGINVNLQTGLVIDAWGGHDLITGIEEVVGSRFRDIFLGTATERNFFTGLRGADSFNGGIASYDANGARTGDHRDTVSYNSDHWMGGTRGIIVDLETAFSGGSITGTIRDGFGNLDTVRDIERVDGTRYNDVFVGSRENNVFRGGEGVDSYNGDAGFDRIDFDRWFGDAGGPTTGVNINLSLASGQILNDGFGNVENAVNIEQIRGTARADTVIGTAADEAFALGAGADTITGGGGVDYFEWWDSGDIVGVDRILDFTATGANADVFGFEVASFAGMTNTLTLVNGTAATTAGVGTFIYKAGNGTLLWDADGLGGAAARAIAILTNVSALSAANFDLY